MLHTNMPVFRNVLLAAASPTDVSQLLEIVSYVALPPGSTIEAPDQTIEDVYFPEAGVLSVDATTRSGVSMQIAMIGKEGASGMTLALGNRSWPHTTVVNVEV